MKGLFWNIRGMGQMGRVPALVGKIRDIHLDFFGIVETKKIQLSNWLPSLSFG